MVPHEAHRELLKLGCTSLMRKLWRVRPRLHVLGHVTRATGRIALDLMMLGMPLKELVISGGWPRLLSRGKLAYECARRALRPAKEAECLLVNPVMASWYCNMERRNHIVVIIWYRMIVETFGLAQHAWVAKL